VHRVIDANLRHGADTFGRRDFAEDKEAEEERLRVVQSPAIEETDDARAVVASIATQFAATTIWVSDYMHQLKPET